MKNLSPKTSATAAKPTVAALLTLLTAALPYVEEGEEFNKPSAPKLSDLIRSAIANSEDRS